MQILQECVFERKDLGCHSDDAIERLRGILARLSDADRATVWEGVAVNLAARQPVTCGEPDRER